MGVPPGLPPIISLPGSSTMQDTQESVPAYFQIEHKEIIIYLFYVSFLPAYSPWGANPLWNLTKYIWEYPEGSLPLDPSLSPYLQGSYGSWKTWKVIEFYNLFFHAWKVMEFEYRSWKVMMENG